MVCVLSNNVLVLSVSLNHLVTFLNFFNIPTSLGFCPEVKCQFTFRLYDDLKLFTCILNTNLALKSRAASLGFFINSENLFRTSVLNNKFLLIQIQFQNWNSLKLPRTIYPGNLRFKTKKEDNEEKK